MVKRHLPRVSVTRGFGPTHRDETLAHPSFRAQRGICFCDGQEQEADSSLLLGMTGGRAGGPCRTLWDDSIRWLLGRICLSFCVLLAVCSALCAAEFVPSKQASLSPA